MKKIILSIPVLMLLSAGVAQAQKVKSTAVPAEAKTAVLKRYPNATGITWEKEKTNYEANWGGKSGEDMSVMFTPEGVFVEEVVAISPSALPAGITAYVKEKYKVTKIKEAGKVTDAAGAITYEAEVKGRDLIFDSNGKFLKED